MKLFIDTANLNDIEAALKRGFIQGITTNPSLLAKEPRIKFEAHVAQIIELIKKYRPGISLSIEVFSRDPKEMLVQAEHFVSTFKYPELAIKVHIGWDELEVINRLSKKGIAVNCTCCMTVNQAVMAAAAGARFVSLFWCRIRDGLDAKYAAARESLVANRHLEEADFVPFSAIQETRRIFDRAYPNAEIIAGSMRGAVDIKQAGQAGAHIVTVPPKFFPAMVQHYKTDEVVSQFFADFAQWLS